MMDVTIDQARTVKAKAGALARELAPVVGVGLARVDGSYVVKVNLREAAGDLPGQVDGVPILYEVTGAITKRAS